MLNIGMLRLISHLVQIPMVLGHMGTRQHQEPVLLFCLLMYRTHTVGIMVPALIVPILDIQMVNSSDSILIKELGLPHVLDGLRQIVGTIIFLRPSLPLRPVAVTTWGRQYIF